jgi:hypothetical protein
MEFNGPRGTLQIAFALLVGLATMGYGAYSYSEQTTALDAAVEVNATIASTSVEEVPKKRSTDYRPTATFEYSYRGETYTSSNVYPGTLPREFGSREAASAELAEYEPGDTVTAYVRPGAPGNAFLKHESTNRPFLVIGFGALFVLGGAYSALRE